MAELRHKGNQNADGNICGLGNNFFPYRVPGTGQLKTALPAGFWKAAFPLEATFIT